MNPDSTKRARSAARRRGAASSLFCLLGAVMLTQPMSAAYAFPNPTTVDLKSASAFTVLAGATVTNTGTTVVSADAGIGGNLGVSPGSAVTGFPPGQVTPPGSIHAADSVAATAVTDATAALSDIQGRSPNTTFPPVHDLGGQTFTAGVYNDPSSLAVTGTVTLDGAGNPDSVFIFQAGSTLGTAAASTVLLTNGAQACNVFWGVGSSATLGANSAFNGTIVALTSMSAGNGADIQGRVLAGSGDITGAVTLDTDVIHTPTCASNNGVPQMPLAGSLAPGVAVAAFLAGAAVLVVRRRPKHIR